MKHWNKLTALSLAGLMAVSLAACGGGGEKEAASTAVPAASSGTAPTAAPKKEVTISVLTQSIGPKSVIEKFKKEHPEITVKWEQFDTNQVREAMKTRIAAGGEGLDIISPQLNDYAPLGEQGTWLDISNEKFLSNVDQVAIDNSAKVNGKVYGVPFTRQSYVVWYNKDIFAKYNLTEPKNWEEFLQVCETLKKNGVPPIALPGKEGWVVSVLAGLPYAELFSKDPVWLDKASKGQVKWTDPESVQALEKYKQVTDNYLLEGSLGTGYDQAYQAFYQGKAAMMVNGIWSIDLIVKNTPTFQVGAFAPPGNAKGQTPKLGFIYGNIYSIASTSKNKEAALTFLGFLTQPENAQLFMNDIKQFSNIKGVTADFHPATKVIDPLFSMERSMMIHSQASPSVRTDMGAALQKLIGKVATPEQVAKELQASQDRDIKK